MIKLIVIWSFLLSGLVLFQIAQRSKAGLIVRQKFNNDEVTQAFRNTAMTGKDFLNKVLAMNGVSNYKLVSSRSKTVYCFPRLLVISPEFSEPLKVETFNTTLHELKHIKDKSISYLKYLFDFMCLVCFAVIVVHMFRIATVPSIELVYIAAISVFLITSILGLICETRARKFVCSEYANQVLSGMNFQNEIIQTVTGYLRERIQGEIFWHNMTSITLVLLVMSFLVGGVL